MSQSEQRIQRIAVGFAVGAMLVAVLAVFVVVRRHPEPSRRALHAGSAANRHVRASDLRKLTPSAVKHLGDGLHVVDDALGKSLGLAREDLVVAISGRPVPQLPELHAVLRDLEAFRPSSLFVDLVRDREPVLERWEIDGELDAARRAPVANRGSIATSDPLIATVNQIDSTTYELPRSTVEAWSADPTRVISGITSAQHLSNPEGFQIVTVRPGSLIAALGIEDGDVIRGLNGIELASIETILPLIAKSTTRISIDLQRHGRTIILNYLIK